MFQSSFFSPLSGHLRVISHSAAPFLFVVENERCVLSVTPTIILEKEEHPTAAHLFSPYTHDPNQVLF